jgi:NAD(P)-dependent dehydrogenase (short-subunit alcohol dehydrogenase family)
MLMLNKGKIGGSQVPFRKFVKKGEMNIVITGASRGVGFETAKLLAGRYQCTVTAISRNQDGLQRLEEIAGGKIRILPFDIESTDPEEVAAAITKIMPGGVDVLINNAGALVSKPFNELNSYDFQRMFRVNVESPFRLIQALNPFFREPAHIVNIGSMGGFQGSAKFPGLSLYSASKGALAILTECLAVELNERRISVNCLALGAAQTEMLAQAFPGYTAPLTASGMAEFIAEFSVSGHQWFNGKIIPVSLSTP